MGKVGVHTITRRESLVAIGGLVTVSAVGSADAGLPNESRISAFEPTNHYAPQEVRGWKILVNRGLADQKPLFSDVQALLDHQLYQITRVIPAGALAKLRKTAIWLEEKEPHHPCMCYHPDIGWLREHEMNPDKARCVEVANAENFLKWTMQQPWMVLHELAHAYHHTELGFDNKDVRAAYDCAGKSGSYEKVLHWDGKTVRHYALTDEKEYFAELTESYFGTNDFYPFVRSELAQFDPAGFKMIETAWGV